MNQDYFSRRKPGDRVDYEQSYWGTITDPDGNVRNRLQEREKHLDDIKQELAFLNSLQPGRLLDIGCGLGYLLSGLSDDWEKHGIELSRFAAEHASHWGKIRVGNVIDAHFPDGYFDVVVIYHVIEHMEDPIGTILEARRILKPGGILLLGTPDFDSGCARRFGDNYRLLHDPTHISLFTNESMHRFLRDYGFVIDRVEYPFFETRYFTSENLLRLFDTNTISPPFYGNFMTFYCHKPDRSRIWEAVMDLSRLAKQVADTMDSHIERAGALVADSVLSGGKVLACGNGGSAADAQHFVAELVGRMSCERKSLPAVALSTDPSIVTALGNDYGYDRVFARQIEGLGCTGDVLVAISTSGRSPNVLRAIDTAHERKLKIIALVGQSGDPLMEDADVCIHIPSPNTQRVQELHTAVLHAICDCVEQRIVGMSVDLAESAGRIG